MDNSKINQSELNFSCGVGLANLNLKSGRLLFECPGLSIGANSFKLNISLIYNSKIKNSDFDDLKIGLGNGWKLNVQQYVFPYKASYNLIDFNEGDYVYIDSNWNIHRFIKYNPINSTTYNGYYYDQSGTGLRLKIDKNTDGQIDLQIFDGNNNILKFDDKGRLTNIISCFNTDIEKVIIYNGDNLISIYDSRKSGRQIYFTYYTNGLLSTMTANTHNVSYQYNYNNLNQLDKVIKNDGTKVKDAINFTYDDIDVLNYAIDAESLRALCFGNDKVISDPKIIYIKEGAMKKQYIDEEIDSEIYLGEEVNIGERYFFTKNGKKLKGYNLQMPDKYVKNKTEFIYLTNCTDVINDKNIRTRYYFNINGFTSSILEVDSTDINNCKTLFKTSGWQLSNDGVSHYKLNGQKANILINTHKYEAVNLDSFLSIFEDYDNGAKRKNEYTENFVISFWLKADIDITYDIYAKVFITKDGVTEEYGKTLIDRTLGDTWQYLTIPVFLGENQHKISNIRIEFSGLNTSETLYLADFRIAIGNSSTTKFIDDTISIDLKDVTTVVSLNKDGTNNVDIISSDCYFTDSDLFATYKSLYYKEQEGKNEFDLIYCSGTKVKAVTSVNLYTSNKYVTLKINEKGIPNYYTYSSNRTAESQWNVTETQVRFHKENQNKYYFETKIAIQMMDTKGLRVEENNSSKTYEWYNSNGTFRSKKDEYSVVTANHYDSYGNLISVSVYNDDAINKEYLLTTYDYGTVEESLRENPKSCTQNGVKKEFYYNEPHFSTDYTLEENSKINYEYDSFNEKVTLISNVNNQNNLEEYKNTILYDENGRIKSVSDLSGRTYGFIYNVFGEPLKYYENKRLVLEKKLEKGNAFDTLTEKIYNNDELYEIENIIIANENITEIDGYGRILSQTNKEKSTEEGTKILFNYQNVKESNAVSKIDTIVDPYEELTYTYIYDDENRPCGYKAVNTSEGYKVLNVRQTEVGNTQYYFSSDNQYIMSMITKEDSEYADGEHAKFFNPRIKRTKYVTLINKQTGEFEEKFKEFNFEYKYDDLGRLSKKANEKVECFALGFNNLVNVEKNLTYENSKTTIEKIEYVTNSVDTDSNYNATLTFSNTYDNKNNLIQMISSGERFIDNPTKDKLCDKEEFITRNIIYEYDEFDKLIKETRFDNGEEVLNLEYDYYKNSGNLRKIIKNGSVLKQFNYYNGRVTRISYQDFDYQIKYDNYGNIVKDQYGTCTYNSRNLMDCYIYAPYTPGIEKTSNYLYNYQGVRYKKTVKDSYDITKYVNYYVDGSRILGEDWSYSDGSEEQSMRYFYDAEGIAGLTYDGHNFNFIKDTLGNVSKIMYQGRVIGEYIYDAWGNCEVVELSIGSDTTNGARDRFVLHNNPFRWKSHYRDSETKLYYIHGRYYSPMLMQYLNADNIENITPYEVNSLNRHAITLDNSISYEENQDTIFTDTEYYPDPTYEPIKNKSWWSLNWKKAIQWISFTTLFVVSIVLMCIPATSSFGVGMFVAGLKAAVSGALIGGIIGGVVNVVNGKCFMEGLVSGAVEGFINGFTTGALMFCASQAITAFSNASNARCTTPGNCFIVGTLILTSLGNKKIEDIKIGDEVWAYDEETGEKSLKKVVNLFRNKTKKWIHLLFEVIDGAIEELVCTEGHPFYVNNIGWVKSIDLLENDEVLMYNNNIAVLIKKEIEELEQEETTYNFEVEDYHTYFVGEHSVLVHNDCIGSYDIEFESGRHYVGKGSEARMNRSARRIQKKYGDKVVNKTFVSAPNDQVAFVREHMTMAKYNFDFTTVNHKGLLYNRINSPGRRIFELWF